MLEGQHWTSICACLWILQALLRRLADNSAEVVSVALGLSMLRLVPPAALFDVLSSIITRVSTSGKALKTEAVKAQRGNARKVSNDAAPLLLLTTVDGRLHRRNHCVPGPSRRCSHIVRVHSESVQACCSRVSQAVKVLAGDFLQRHPSYSNRIGALMLGLLLPVGGCAGNSKLPLTALKAIRRINHPLLDGETLRQHLCVVCVKGCVSRCCDMHTCSCDR